MGAEEGDQLFHVVRKGGLKSHGLIGNRMSEAEQGGVEGLPGDEGIAGGVVSGAFGAGDVAIGEMATLIIIVAHYGIAQMREVDAYLVGAAGFEFEFEEGVIVVDFPNPVDGYRWLA